MKSLIRKIFPVALIATVLGACTCQQNQFDVTVSNPTNFDRGIETVKVDLGQFASKDAFVVLEKESGDEILSQLLDTDGDSIYEAVIFQVSLKAKEAQSFIVKQGESSIEPTEVKTYARFVPERTDDFTWENDRVGFRVYGPKAQKMVEEGVNGGTLSGGVDCWLKKVDYSVINKWYKGYLDNPNYYHQDRGEGLDNYHVGPSLGCGGTGVMYEGNLYPHVNYTAYEVINNGPVNTTFNLDYAPYKAGDANIQEKKQLSIDLGSNLTKFVIEVEGTNTLTTGITLHDKQGEVSVDSTAVWAGYWSPHFGEELGNAIVVDPKYFAGYSKVISEEKDKSHLLVHLKVIDGKVEYYGGFAWSGSKQFESKEAWEKYLTLFAKQVQNPLTIKIGE